MILNVNASFSEEDHTGSYGVVIRDHLFIGASTAKLEHSGNIVSAEAATLADGLKLAANLGINSLLLQMDNLIVVESLNTDYSHSMVGGPLLDICRSFMEDFGKVLSSIVIGNLIW